MQKVSYMGNGSTTEFSFNFPYFENTNVKMARQPQDTVLLAHLLHLMRIFHILGVKLFLTQRQHHWTILLLRVNCL